MKINIKKLFWQFYLLFVIHFFHIVMSPPSIQYVITNIIADKTI